MFTRDDFERREAESRNRSLCVPGFVVQSILLPFARKPKKIAPNEDFFASGCGASGGALSCRRTRKYPKKSAQGEALRACSRNQSHPPPENPLPARTAVRKRNVLVLFFSGNSVSFRGLRSGVGKTQLPSTHRLRFLHSLTRGLNDI